MEMLGEAMIDKNGPNISPLAGKPPQPGMLVNIPKLITSY
jgi:hypothetical protein